MLYEKLLHMLGQRRYTCDTKRKFFFKGSLVAQRLERQKMKELVIDLRFIPMLNNALVILKTIDVLSVKYHSDSIPIS